MAADHTLADRVLADQLERHAAQRFVGEPVSGMCRAAAVRLRKLDAIEPLIAKFRAEWDAAGWGNTPDDDAISAAAYLERAEQ